MVKLLVVGGIFGTSGYAVHTRSLVNALYNEGIDIALETQLYQGCERELNDNELLMAKNNRENCDGVLLITLPTIAPMYWHTDKPVYQYCVFEGDKIPLQWNTILKNDRIKYVIVPSNHVKKAIENTDNSYINKVKVIPHGVDLDIFKPTNLKDKKFTFVCNKGWVTGSTDRGGLSFLMKAFAEEFNKDENVKLLVKINTAYPISQQSLDMHIKELNIQNKNSAEIEILSNVFNTSELCNFYNRGHVYVIPSLAEAFCIPGLEAMACGLPVIYSDFGGQTDYCNSTNSISLSDGVFKEVSNDALYEGIKWKVPNIEDLRRKLRFMYKQPLDNDSKNAIETASKYSWKNSAKLLKELL